MSSLLDQSALTDLAERLVTAARRAGADAADAVAVRSMSLAVEVREGAVEESERSESDDVGCACSSAAAARWCRPTTSQADVTPLAERAVAMAKVAPEDKFAGLADPAQLAHASRSRSARSRPAVGRGAGGSRHARRGGGARGQGREQVGRRLRVGRHRRHGAGDQPRLSRRLSRLPLRRLDVGHRRRRHRDGDRLRFFLRAALPPISIRPRRSDAPPASARWRGSIRARSRPRKVPVVFDQRIASSLVGHLAGAINGSAVARKTSFLKDKRGERLFRPGIRIVDDPLRQRGQRSRPFDGEGVAGTRLALIDDGVLTSWLLDSATARELGLPPPATRSAACRRRRRRARPICISKPGAHTPGALMADIARWLLCHRADRHGRQSGDRRLQPRRLRLLDRERPAHLIR